jgi:hypothetical protein
VKCINYRGPYDILYHLTKQFRKAAISFVVSVCLSVCPFIFLSVSRSVCFSVHVKQLGCRWMDSTEILHRKFISKSIDQIKFILESQKTRERRCTCKRSTEAPSRNHCCRAKAVSATYSECALVALIIHSTMCMRRTFCRLWPVWLCHIFPRYLINSTLFGKENILNTKRVFRFSRRPFSETFLILWTERDTINVHRSSCKVPVLVRF